jgi:hypothetical protein
MASDLADTIAENAAGPKRVSGDAGSVDQHSLLEQIQADRYVKSVAGVKRSNRGLRFNKVCPPGAI